MSSNNEINKDNQEDDDLGNGAEQIQMDEAYDETYEPSDEELRSYFKEILGAGYDDEPDLQWIAYSGLKARLPPAWGACKDSKTNEIYYFNYETGESLWIHPCDQIFEHVYKELLKLRKKDKFIGRSIADAVRLKLVSEEILADSDLKIVRAAENNGKHDVKSEATATQPKSTTTATAENQGLADEVEEEPELKISGDKVAGTILPRVQGRMAELGERDSADSDLNDNLPHDNAAIRQRQMQRAEKQVQQQQQQVTTTAPRANKADPISTIAPVGVSSTSQATKRSQAAKLAEDDDAKHLAEQHTKELAAVGASSEAKVEAAVAKAKTESEVSAAKVMETLCKAHEENVEALNKQQAAELDKLKQNHIATIADLKKQNTSELEELRKNHHIAVAKLEQEQREQLQSLQSQHKPSTNMPTENAALQVKVDAVAPVAQEMDTERHRAKDELERLRKAAEELQAEIQRMVQEKAQLQGELQTLHEESMKQKEEFNQLEDALQRSQQELNLYEALHQVKEKDGHDDYLRHPHQQNHYASKQHSDHRQPLAGSGAAADESNGEDALARVRQFLHSQDQEPEMDAAAHRNALATVLGANDPRDDALLKRVQAFLDNEGRGVAHQPRYSDIPLSARSYAAGVIPSALNNSRMHPPMTRPPSYKARDELRVAAALPLTHRYPTISQIPLGASSSWTPSHRDFIREHRMWLGNLRESLEASHYGSGRYTQLS